jgi:hypothetical protein
MKFKLSGKRFMSFFFILIMIGSTASYALIQSYHFFNAPQSNPEEIPKSNIINYQVKPDVKDTIIKSGFTIIDFYYRPGCLECSNLKTMLENLANKNKNQILLQELNNANGTVPEVVITSYKDTNKLDKPTTDQVNGVLCDLMASPPVELECSLRNS